MRNLRYRMGLRRLRECDSHASRLIYFRRQNNHHPHRVLHQCWPAIRRLLTIATGRSDNMNIFQLYFGLNNGFFRLPRNTNLLNNPFQMMTVERIVENKYLKNHYLNSKKIQYKDNSSCENTRR